MNLLLRNTDGIKFSCKADLAKAIPSGMQGSPINYGQGEGQVKIEETVWGFYVTASGNYYMAFEEGEVEWADLVNIVSAIVRTLSQNFCVDIQVQAIGPFTGATDV